MIRAIGLLAFLVLASCPGCPPAPPPVTPDASDAAAAPGTCAAVCQNGRRLGCPFAQPTPQGASCEEVCSNVQGTGIATWDLGCRSAASSCAAIDACR